MSRRPPPPQPPAAPDAAAPQDQDATASPPAKKVGRPRGKREVAVKMTICLDTARHVALRALAADQGRSIHSLILDGIDAMTERRGLMVSKKGKKKTTTTIVD